MTMFESLSPKQYAQLLFWPIAVITLFILSLPTMGVQWLMATNHLPFLAGWFLCIPTLSAAWLTYLVLIDHLKRWSARKAMHKHVDCLIHAGCFPTVAGHLRQQANRGEWRMLMSMSVLFGLHVAFVKPAVRAQAPDIERAEPRLAGATTEQLRIVRCLQHELRLNEHGTLRALKYLRQGYGEAYVRNLFASTVRKS